ncbi:complex I NDUFA9 subunit family protein [Roseobacter sp. HKCCA0434]|uniref:complex I NDUFA9 subunit family protein n=1 Tax=Roseobacter sp. HKCCA0434 TaxID=3079297 RepID=UPI002905B674|nr:complex I NDUFA9 subunit family protein [Roseobacter sp. HKCCA0434]
MTMTQPLATVFGGSGFVGRYIVQALAHSGWRVRVAVRRPNEAMFTMTYGTTGQVQPVQANIRDEASTRAALMGADLVVNCVGILFPDGKQKFDAVQTEGAARIARLAAAEGVSRMVHISAIGADINSGSDYAVSKAEGEAAVLEHMPDAYILRPSIVFGPEDGFFNRFGNMAARLPVVPVVGGDTRFQPVYVDDVADAAVACAEGRATPGVYELGGPDIETFRTLMERIKRVTLRPRRVLMGVPFWLAGLQGRMLDLLPTLTFGVVPNSILTRDQVRLLRHDNVVGEDAIGFADLGIVPRDMDGILESYLWRFRPNGQYAEMLGSAKNLRHE